MRNRRYSLITLCLLSQLTLSVQFVHAAQADPLEPFSDDAARTSYCFYTRAMELQYATQSGRDPLKLLPMLQILKTWESTVATLLPEKEMRNEEMIASLSEFNERTLKHTESGLAPDAAKQTVIEESAGACTQLLAQLQNKKLTPRTKRDVVAAATESAAPSTTPVPAKQPDTPLPTFTKRNPDSPFHKGVFAPGWRGDLSWRDSEFKTRAVLMSFDTLPPGRDAVAIHANLRIYGAKAYCVDHIVEVGSSPDGVTLYAKPVEGNTCGSADRNISLYAVAEDKLRIEIRDDGMVVASGDFQPTAHDARFTFSKPLLATVEPTSTTTSVSESASETASGTSNPSNNNAPSAPIVKQPTPKLDQPKSTRPCWTCLPIEDASDIADDLMGRLLNKPLKGQFDWNWQKTGFIFDRSKGTLSRTSATDASRQTFELSLDSKKTLVCLGLLREIGRSAGGYLVHLKADPPAGGQRCEPQVTHGYILPFATRGAAETRHLWIKLYSANDRQVTSSILRFDQLHPAVSLDAEKAERAMKSVAKMEKAATTGRMEEKFVAFKTSANYQDIAPLYEGCMKAAPDIFGVTSDSAYCQCISQKFGIGGRLPEAEFVRYSQDITPLIKLLTGPENSSTKLYKRIGETCRQCSHPDGELKTWCSEQDSHLYVASNYADMIRLLDKAKPTVEASKNYKREFYRTYLQGYSALCNQHIVDPVPFEYTVTEFRIGDPWASPDGDVVHRDETFVARAYAAKYKRFYDERTSPRNATPTSAASLRRMISDGKKFLETERADRASISQHLNQGCETASVQRVYGNLLHLVE